VSDPIDPFAPGPGGAGDLSGAPLFRELQRVLSASSGPVNWELARQVGIATAAWGGDDGVPSDADRAAFVEAVRIAELAVADLTKLPMPADLVEVQVVRRDRWVDVNIEVLGEVIDPVAAKLATALEGVGGGDAFGPGAGPGPLPGIGFGPPGGPAGSDETGDESAADAQAQMFRQLMGTLGPLLMGAQVGTVLGTMAQRVLGQYDLALPRRSGALLFVLPNIARFESDWSLPPGEFRAYVALHEVAHRFEFAQAWVRPHFLGLVRDLVDHADVDVASLQQRFEGLDPSNPDAMREAMESAGSMFDAPTDPEQRLRLARLQAFMAATEGHADHVMKTIGAGMLASFDRIEEALKRHREGRGSEGALEQLLGLQVTVEQYHLGEEFCARIVEVTDEATLSRMWGSAGSLPSMPELEEPTLWLSRTV
jgi:putative hydrolase